MSSKINIRPGVSILSVLKHLNYKPWYALAEFVDNAIDSYQKDYDKIIKVEGKDFVLKVEIEINSYDKKIVIKDNAGGIHKKEFSRAFRTAELPPDTSGLSEFGMGMKSASCWFTNYWEVRTKAINDQKESTISFDINKIVKDKLEELEIKEKKSEKEEHYTIITLKKVNNIPTRKTIGKIKKHLSSIYRDFFRKGELILKYNGEELKHHEPKILKAPYFKDEKGKEIEWKKEINLKVDGGIGIKGFAAIRETASTTEAGFALFRKGRVIEGSADEGYRPQVIFGHSNSYAYQRLFGELHISGVRVSHTKDGIQWKHHLEQFLDLLKKELEKEPRKLLSQANGFRKRPKISDIRNEAQKSLDRTSDVIQASTSQQIGSIRSNSNNNHTKPDEDCDKKLKKCKESLFRDLNIEIEGEEWKIHIELSYDDKLKDLFEIGDSFIDEKQKKKNARNVGIRLSLPHPFMSRFAGTDNTKIEPILRIAAALCLSEIMARDSGVKLAGSIRRNMNELLGGSLSKP